MSSENKRNPNMLQLFFKVYSEGKEALSSIMPIISVGSFSFRSPSLTNFALILSSGDEVSIGMKGKS